MKNRASSILNVIARSRRDSFACHCEPCEAGRSNPKTGSEQAAQSQGIASLTSFARNDNARKRSSLAMTGVLILLLASCLLFSRVAFAEEIKWEEKKATHFIIYSMPDVESSYVDEAIDTAEGYYRSLEEKLGLRRFDYWTWENRVKIYIYADQESYVEATGRPEWSGGSANIPKKIISSYYRASQFFERLLPHELTHIVFREYIGVDTTVPLWLDEGMATNSEQGYYQRYVPRALEWIEEGKDMDFDALHRVNIGGISSSSSQATAFYCYSASLVHYLWQAFGREKFQKFCKEVREEGESIEDALLDVYNFDDTEELTKKWFDYLRSE